MSEQTLDVSWEAIIKVFIVGLILYVLFLVKDIALWFFFALIISILLEPAVDFLRKIKFPKILAVVLIYVSIFGLLGLMIYLTAPIFTFEINQLAHNIPEYFEKLNPILQNLGFDVATNFQDFMTNLISLSQESSKSIIKAISVFFGGIASTILIFVFAFYISLEEKGPERFLAILVPKKYEDYVASLFEKSQYKVSGWFGARVLTCVFVGVASFAVFFLLGIKYAFILALVSGILNFIPYIGPLITGILTILFVGVSSSWLVGIYAIAALYLIQILENNVVSPLLMKKFLDLPPILVLISLLIGGTLFGVLGMIFVVPVFGIIYEASKEFLLKKKEEMVY